MCTVYRTTRYIESPKATYTWFRGKGRYARYFEVHSKSNLYCTDKQKLSTLREGFLGGRGGALDPVGAATGASTGAGTGAAPVALLGGSGAGF